MSSTPRNLDDLVTEARQHLVPDAHATSHDWQALEGAIDTRAHEPARLDGLEPRHRARRGNRWALASGVALAAAAAATLVFRPAPPPVREAAPEAIAATVESAPGGFRILSARGERGVSSPLHVGDRIETGAASVSFVSRSESQPSQPSVAWQVEAQSQLVVASARAPLGLTLENGAVEADVARVPRGEAFVVDVGPVRVAVKGTHLRVARVGDHATVDLTEGTIAIGAIPASGLTTGRLVTAPAHVEIDLLRPTELRVTDGEAVRARAFDHDVRVAAAQPSARAMTPPPPVTSTVTPPVPRPAPGATGKPLATSAAPDLRAPDEIVRDAIRACIDKHIASGPVRVMINSTLTLDIEAGGAVKLARFEPPLAPEVQQCASGTIYKTRFPGATIERIAIAAER